MITVQGRYEEIHIPSSWDDLNRKQLRFTAEQLLSLTSGKITLQEFQIRLLLNYTGYRPDDHLRNTTKMVWFYLRLLGAMVRYMACGRGAWKVLKLWVALNKPGDDPDTRETINENLVYLSSLITFPVKDGNAYVQFLKNPIPAITIRGRRYHGKRFDVGVVNLSDITAREFCDCVDLIKAFALSKNEMCLNQICAILYPRHKEFHANLMSKHVAAISNVDYMTRYLVMLWFISVVTYFTEHPIYRVLFAGNKEADSDKISVGMYEGIMHLSLNGFGSKEELESVNVVEYFDLQVKVLKKIIGEMKGSGMKDTDIAKTTGLSLNTIDRL